MASLYKNQQVFSTANKLTLFWVPGGMPLMLDLEGAVAAALKLRGHKVHAIICDGVFSACVKREITDKLQIEEWAKSCGVCRSKCSDALSQIGIEHSFIGDYVSAEERLSLKRESYASTWDTVESLEHDQVMIGKNIKSSIVRYLKGHDLPQNARLVQEYAYSGLVCATAAKNAFDQMNPARVFMSHGGYVDWGPALHTSLNKQIPVSAWMASYLPFRFYFRHISDRAHVDLHNMSDDAWAELSATRFTEDQQRRLDSYLSDRYMSNTSFDMQRLKPYRGKSLLDMQRYGLSESMPVWGIMAHINWDSVSDYAPMLYSSFDEWIVDTIEVACQITNVQWLIKIHPAEAWDESDSGVHQLIRNKFSNLPANIRVIAAEENISPLDFFELVDGAVTVYGTSGLELAIHGKPVILAGDAHYGKKGFTWDANSRSAYRGLLQQASRISSLSSRQVDLAKKYAYCYFILRQIPMSVVANPPAKWWRFQFDQRERLLPGKDPAIDFLCERLIDGKDFIMSPRLEIEANNYKNKKI